MALSEIEKKYQRTYYLKNKEAKLARNKVYQEENPEVMKKASAKWRDNNRELCVQMSTEWRKLHKDTVYSYNKARKRKIRQSTPPWQSRKELQTIYMECQRITRETGIEHHVDHIIPLINELVSGLTVPWNLQIIPAKENIQKGNRL